MNNKEVAKEWFEFAMTDLKSAKFLLNMYAKPIEIICYHCQQSAEEIEEFVKYKVKQSE